MDRYPASVEIRIEAKPVNTWGRDGMVSEVTVNF
jgi:hypothetical protein